MTSNRSVSRNCRSSNSVVLIAVFVFSLLAVSPGQVEAADNRVVTRLQQDQAVIGTFGRSARADLDFVVIDEQYTELDRNGEIDIDGVSAALAKMQLGDRAAVAAPIVRIPLVARDAPQAVVRQLLGAGVFGVMFPDIETPQQAMAAIDSMGSQRATGTDLWPLAAAGNLVAMIQIESPLGIEHLDEILDVPGIGVIFLGPTDIASAIGAEGPNSPRVETLVQEVLAVCLARNIACGYPIVAATPEDADQQTARRLQEGFKVLAVMTRAR